MPSVHAAEPLHRLRFTIQPGRPVRMRWRNFNTRLRDEQLNETLFRSLGALGDTTTTTISGAPVPPGRSN